MLSDNRQINSIIIVFIGDFNPVIIQPFWLAEKKLIKDQEAETASVDVIHNELVRFALKWASFHVTRDRFEVRTLLEHYFEPLRDLVLGIFKVLAETPVRAVGINHIRHYTLENEKIYRGLGDKLVPFKNWDSIMKQPEVLGVEMIERLNPYEYWRIRVQPSDTLKPKNSIMLNMNDHHDISTKAFGPSEALDILSKHWSIAFKKIEIVEQKIDEIIKQ